MPRWRGHEALALDSQPVIIALLACFQAGHEIACVKRGCLGLMRIHAAFKSRHVNIEQPLGKTNNTVGRMEADLGLIRKKATRAIEFLAQAMARLAVAAIAPQHFHQHVALDLPALVKRKIGEQAFTLLRT